MKSTSQGLKLYTSIIVIVLVAVSTIQPSSVLPSNNTVVYAYSNSQAQSFANDCGNDGSSGINCANSGPQNIGDDTVTTMTPSQISNSGKEGPQGPVGPAGPTGPAGPDKILSARTVRSDPVIIQPGISGPGVSAFCDSDEIVTGGGFNVVADISAPSATWDVETNSRTNTAFNGWIVTIHNTGSKPVSLTTSVQCLKLVPPP